MVATNYPKAVNTTNFANGVVNPGRLTYDIETYVSPTQDSITRVLQEINVEVYTSQDDICNIWFKEELSVEEQTMLDNICLVHTGESMPSEVTPVTLEPTGSNLKDLQAVGCGFEADFNTDTEYFVSFDEAREVQGVSIEMVNHTYGVDKDTLEIAIVAPDGAGGWVPARYLVKGPTDSWVPVPPSGTATVIAEGTAPMPTFLRIRVTYRSTATTGNKPYIHLLFRTWM
jgi:hypothetical protein